MLRCFRHRGLAVDVLQHNVAELLGMKLEHGRSASELFDAELSASGAHREEEKSDLGVNPATQFK